MSGKAANVLITERQQTILEQMSRFAAIGRGRALRSFYGRLKAGSMNSFSRSSNGDTIMSASVAADCTEKMMRPGQKERIEFGYIRHGTQCPIPKFHVVAGESIARRSVRHPPKKTFLEQACTVSCRTVRG